MTGLEPHPIFRLPTREEAEAMGPARFAAVIEERRRRMELELQDPFHYGYESPIWHICDDLLCDGKDVRLALPNGVDAPPSIVKGAPELLITGWNRSAKSEYGGKKSMKVITDTAEARGWAFADTGPISIARQQPIFWKYMPSGIRRLAQATGRAKQGTVMNVSYSQKGGFTEQTFVLPNKSQQWFKNYAQDIENLEGDQLDVCWFDELRNPEFLRTMRFRMGDRAGIIIVTFTPIDEKKFGASYNEYQRGARTVLEVEGDLLPVYKPILPAPVLAGVTESNHTPRDHSLSVNDSIGIAARGSTLSEILPPAGNYDPRGGQNSPNEESVFNPREGMELVGYEKVPRVKVAGPGSEGTQRANIVYFHIQDNPFYAFKRNAKPGVPQLSGKDVFRRFFAKATRAVIRARAYAILETGGGCLFPKFNAAVHVIPFAQIPKNGTNYHIVDPCPGRNWFMTWMRVVPIGGGLVRRYFYREWPSFGHAGGYIPGIGDIGAWALPGKAADGEKGPAQTPLGWGLNRYKQEILRLEGVAPEKQAEAEGRSQNAELRSPNGAVLPGDRSKPARALFPPVVFQVEDDDHLRGGEVITERRMDSRYAASPTQRGEGNTTLLEQMSEIGMEFYPSSGRDIDDGIELIKDAMDYDSEVPIGKYSPAMARINEPLLQVADTCPNIIYALTEYTGLDGLHGALKDVVDVVRYGVMDGLEHVDEDAFTWQGGMALAR